MTRKILLLALSVMSAALFALPAVASATPAHITPSEPFTVTPDPVTPVTTLETVDGETIHCTKGASGSGNWHSTTTGTLTLTFSGCFTVVFGFNVSCTTHPDAAGTITTTKLPFHLIMIDHPVGSSPKKPGVLITPGTNNHFASFTCGGVNKTVGGNGVIGTITSPSCNAAATTTADLSFEQGANTGIQTHTTYTGVNYHLESANKKAAQIGKGRIHFNNPQTLVCT